MLQSQVDGNTQCDSVRIILTHFPSGKIELCKSYSLWHQIWISLSIKSMLKIHISWRLQEKVYKELMLGMSLKDQSGKAFWLKKAILPNMK